MEMKVTIIADSGEGVMDVVPVDKKADVETGVRSTLSLFRIKHPEVPPFGLTIRLDHA
jgi:hypothetical protein